MPQRPDNCLGRDGWHATAAPVPSIAVLADKRALAAAGRTGRGREDDGPRATPSSGPVSVHGLGLIARRDLEEVYASQGSNPRLAD